MNVDGFSILDIVLGAIVVGGGLGTLPPARAGEFAVGTQVSVWIHNPRGNVLVRLQPLPSGGLDPLW